jgi:lipoate-protein ligase A
LRWQVQRHVGPLTVDISAAAPVARAVWFVSVERPTLVLGSTQRAVVPVGGVDAVRRRSGGGAVLVAPDTVLWAEVVLPVADPLWSADVGCAFWWLGDAWAAALRSLGFDAAVHRGALVSRPLSRVACFAGLGPGEVTVGEKKVVGMSQRRTRAGALFQCAALLRWDAPSTARALGLAADSLDRVAAAGLDNVTRADLEDAFLRSLPG